MLPPKYGMGWVPDHPDHRDHPYSAPHQSVGPLPARVDLTPHCPRIYDQGQLGSATANAIAAAIEYEQMKRRLNQVFTPSRLFIYYHERARQGTVASDAGGLLRDAIKSVAKQGACPESLWPYEAARFASRPPHAVYREARQYQPFRYARLARSLVQMKACLAEGSPFVCGFTCYESLMRPYTEQTGHILMPQPDEKMIGGHSVMVVGFDDARQKFAVRNSWGGDWGRSGYGTIPYAYLLCEHLSDDFWTVRIG